MVPLDHPLPFLYVIVEDFHTPTLVTRVDNAPFRVVSVEGEPRRYLPTFISYPWSKEFRPDDIIGETGTGEVFNSNHGGMGGA